ncbi:DUF3318 domain-containing protein [Paraburkholderia sabiae]|jgi:hypothetical protein|uniref:DUF3318 domain-containing protein n=1 Tax=Paraburkholderia sabiae TaxID=273251 RepID=A0ABU9QK75_9BURK|nr:DUF3318 domain-containing protein [Paraburkholderia sabiae]WJZ73594.1 DUF3318 domain-containing protein [Paraburkholderia sabiae]CAD6541477.1 hypothetical protein LMG24235_03648 [Paraburkholderia sabiae]CAG9212347.1 conserved hypothetical protein [Paraburkholderia sabiae]
MSQVHSDNAFRSRRPTAKDLSAPHLRALRKELLIVRADVERMELAQATLELRHAVTHFSWLKFIVPGFSAMGGMPWSRRRGGAAGGIGALLKEYPLISSIVSLVLAKPIRNSVLGAAKPALKWGSVGLAAWEAFRIYQQVKRESRKTATSAAATDADMNPP